MQPAMTAPDIAMMLTLGFPPWNNQQNNE